MNPKTPKDGPVHQCPENLLLPELDRLPSGNASERSRIRWRCPVCGKKWSEGRKGRPLIGDRPQTGVERVRAYRDRKKLPPPLDM